MVTRSHVIEALAGAETDELPNSYEGTIGAPRTNVRALYLYCCICDGINHDASIIAKADH